MGSEPRAQSEAPKGDHAHHATVHVHEDFTLGRLFTPTESRLIEDIQAYLDDEGADCAEDLHRMLDQGTHSLAAIVLAMESYPSLRDTEKLGGKERSQESLTRTLTEGGPHGMEWALPTKAVLSRTFGIAKVNFWTGIGYAIALTETEHGRQLRGRIEDAIDEAVYTRLAEELYGSFATSHTTDAEIRRLAVEHVIDLWEGRTRFATYQFCPILRSAWAARMRAPRTFGTLMGTSEIVQLLFQDCDERFVDVFSARDTDQGMIQAFEEFVFDLPYESLERVRAHMEVEGLTVVSPEEVAGLLGFKDHMLRPLMEGSKALYSSFRVRRVKAQYRTSMQTPGPKRTAESYVLESLLRTEHSNGNGASK